MFYWSVRDNKTCSRSQPALQAICWKKFIAKCDLITRLCHCHDSIVLRTIVSVESSTNSHWSFPLAKENFEEQHYISRIYISRIYFTSFAIFDSSSSRHDRVIFWDQMWCLLTLTSNFAKNLRLRCIESRLESFFDTLRLIIVEFRDVVSLNERYCHPIILHLLEERSNHWIKRSHLVLNARNYSLYYIYRNNLLHRNETSARSRVQIFHTKICIIDLRDKDDEASASLSNIHNFDSDHDSKRENWTCYLRVRARISSHRYCSLRGTSKIEVSAINR